MHMTRIILHQIGPGLGRVPPRASIVAGSLRHDGERRQTQQVSTRVDLFDARTTPITRS